MRAFRDGPIGVLVATTVIEVGVDVPAASVMVIEHAERFGLAQLHQLRGRIGRGAAASTCVLLYAPPISDAARARLTVLRETDDGFRIAEEDLRLRGAGELLGVRQSGLPAVPRRRSRAPRRTAGRGAGRRPAVAGARPRPYEPARPRPAHPPLPLRARPRSEDAPRRMSRAHCLLIRPAESGKKLVRRDTGLLEDAGQSAELQLAVVWDDAADGPAAHHDVTSALAHNSKAEPFQRAYDFRARDARKTTHEPRYRRW